MRIISVFTIGLVVGCQPVPELYTPSNETPAIYWSDGDSGKLGDLRFRLADVDAPETGGVGARGGAKCEYERELGYAAKAFMVRLTRNADLQITADFGEDRYGRRVVTLSADGHDVSAQGIRAGHLEAWPHKGRRALAPKPVWCAQSETAIRGAPLGDNARRDG